VLFGEAEKEDASVGVPQRNGGAKSLGEKENIFEGVVVAEERQAIGRPQGRRGVKEQIADRLEERSRNIAVSLKGEGCAVWKKT